MGRRNIYLQALVVQTQRAAQRTEYTQLNNMLYFFFLCSFSNAAGIL